MLALTRRVGERIIVNDNIVITIVDIRGDNIRIALDAPKEIKIYRGEIYDTIVAENKQAADASQAGDLAVLKGIKRPKQEP